MTIEDYSDGEYVITMGSEADALFIILSGEVVCHLGAGKEELMRQSAGSDSAFFGESCLTDAKVRGANVVAVGPCRCARLRAEVFRALLGTVPELISFNFNMKVLSKCELLSALDSSQLEALVEAMEERTYQPAETIIEQDTIGTTFFIIKSGAVAVLKGGETVSELQKLDYFGERSLLTAEHTAATVRPLSTHAVAAFGACGCSPWPLRLQVRVPEGGEPCVVMTLDKAAFEAKLGALQVLVDRERRRGEAKATAAGQAIVWSDLQLHAVLGEGSFGRRSPRALPPTFVVVRLDMSNGYNAASRTVLLRRLASNPPVASSACAPLAPAATPRPSSRAARPACIACPAFDVGRVKLPLTPFRTYSAG